MGIDEVVRGRVTRSARRSAVSPHQRQCVCCATDPPGATQARCAHGADVVRVRRRLRPGPVDRRACRHRGVEGTLIQLHVSRLPGRRDREHTFRFAKQTMGPDHIETTHPQQADRWTWLIPAAFTQLRLAHPLVGDHRLPWPPPQPSRAFTQGRVRQGFTHLLPRIRHPRPATPNPPGPAPDARKALSGLRPSKNFMPETSWPPQR
jgi:hypothetical protein